MEKKQTYVSPQAEVIDIKPMPLCSSSFGIDPESKGDHEDFSRPHRGTWGNLWAENR